MSLAKAISAVSRIGIEAVDSNETRLEKNLLVVSALMMSTLSVLWGALYFYFQEPLAAAIPLGYAALSYLSITIFALNRRYHFFRTSQILLSLLLPFFLPLWVVWSTERLCCGPLHPGSVPFSSQGAANFAWLRI
jgi:hypothetical protein